MTCFPSMLKNVLVFDILGLTADEFDFPFASASRRAQRIGTPNTNHCDSRASAMARDESHCHRFISNVIHQAELI